MYTPNKNLCYIICMLKNICIIGAGNIGSRHLQALAKVSEPLLIYVVDPSSDSLKLAKSRYEEVQIPQIKHQVTYLEDLENIVSPIDVAIIATNSHIRSLVTKKLFDKTFVKYIIFEKILFDKYEQYGEMKKLLSEKKIKAWVNCSRRTMSFYRNLKDAVKGQKIQYTVSGSQWGLASNTIHLIDHMALLTNCYDFTIDTTYLNPNLIESKRKGFLELTGTLILHFKDDSFGSFTCYPTGDAPQIMQVFSEKFRCLTLETEGKSYISKPDSNWTWALETTSMLYQSKMTNQVVSSLLNFGSCDLTSFELSSRLHVALLEPLLKFINQNSKKKYDSYPFT